MSVSKKAYQECQADAQAWQEEAADYEFRLCDLIFKRQRTAQLVMELRHRWQMWRDHAVNLEAEAAEAAAEAREKANARFDIIEWGNHLLRDRRRLAVRALLGLRKQRQIDKRQHQLDQERINDLEATVAELVKEAGKPRFGL